MADGRNSPGALVETVAKVRRIKNDINTLWPDHLDVLDVEEVLERFDRIVDALFQLLECFESQLAGADAESATRAEAALSDCVRAGCAILDAIAAKKEEQARKAIPIWGGQQFAAPSGKLDAARQLRGRARQLWEDDKYEGYESYMRCISEFDVTIEEANSVRGAHRIMMWFMNPILPFVFSALMLLGTIAAVLIAIFK